MIAPIGYYAISIAATLALFAVIPVLQSYWMIGFAIGLLPGILLHRVFSKKLMQLDSLKDLRVLFENENKVLYKSGLDKPTYEREVAKRKKA